MNTPELVLYRDLLGDIKARVRAAQARAVQSANAEMIRYYWDIGKMILERQRRDEHHSIPSHLKSADVPHDPVPRFVCPSHRRSHAAKTARTSVLPRRSALPYQAQLLGIGEHPYRK